MILVEGMDNTGKTTLVDDIRREFPQLKMRPSIGNKHDLNQIIEQARMEAFEQDMLNMVVSDRSRLISEWIYNPIIGARACAYTFTEWMEMMGAFAQGHHLVIHCYRSTGKIIDNWDEREQLAGVRGHLPQIASAYDQIMHMLRFLFRVGGNPNSRVLTYTFDRSNDQGSMVPVIMQACRLYLHEEAELEREGLR